MGKTVLRVVLAAGLLAGCGDGGAEATGSSTASSKVKAAASGSSSSASPGAASASAASVTSATSSATAAASAAPPAEQPWFVGLMEGEPPADVKLDRGWASPSDGYSIKYPASWKASTGGDFFASNAEKTAFFFLAQAGGAPPESAAANFAKSALLKASDYKIVTEPLVRPLGAVKFPVKGGEVPTCKIDGEEGSFAWFELCTDTGGYDREILFLALKKSASEQAKKELSAIAKSMTAKTGKPCYALP